MAWLEVATNHGKNTEEKINCLLTVARYLGVPFDNHRVPGHALKRGVDSTNVYAH